MTQSIHEEGSEGASDGVRLFSQWWKPSNTPKAVVCLVHSLGELSGRYAHVANVLARPGYLVGAIDLREHGHSSGRRVFIRVFDECLSDVRTLLAQAYEEAVGKPVFLLARSLGGLIATHFVIAERPSIAGLVLTGPLLGFGRSITNTVRMLAVIMGRFFPGITISNALDPATISRAPDVANACANDPLVHHGGLPARTGAEVIKAVTRVGARMEGIQVPLLIFHGTEDRLAAVDGSKRLYGRASSSDKTLRLCEGLVHEVLNEPEREALLDEMLKWLKVQTDGPEQAKRGDDPHGGSRAQLRVLTEVQKPNLYQYS